MWLNGQEKADKVDSMLQRVERKTDGYSISSLFALCNLVFLKKYYKTTQRNYLKIRLAAELAFKLNAGAEDCLDKRGSFGKLVKDLKKNSDSSFSLICRFYLLSLIQEEKDILNDPFFKGTKSRKKEVHKLAVEFENEGLTENNIQIFRKWIKGSLKEKTIFKLLKDAEEKLGRSASKLISRAGLADEQGVSDEHPRCPKGAESERSSAELTPQDIDVF